MWKSKNSTIYVQEYNWTRSPEVWRAVFKWITVAFAIGCIVGATYISSNSDDMKQAAKDFKATSCPATTEGKP